MNKFLPKTTNNPQGFTLIELMVVIAIIAILSVIGVTVFSSVQKNARDAKRRADIDAIAAALETNKTPTGYALLSGSQFASGVIPSDPSSSYKYCANTTASTQPADITASATTTGCSVPGGYSAITAAVGAATSPQPPVGTAWKVCAYLENPATSVYCKVSTQ